MDNIENLLFLNRTAMEAWQEMRFAKMYQEFDSNLRISSHIPVKRWKPGYESSWHIHAKVDSCKHQWPQSYGWRMGPDDSHHQQQSSSLRPWFGSDGSGQVKILWVFSGCTCVLMSCKHNSKLHLLFSVPIPGWLWTVSNVDVLTWQALEFTECFPH